MRCPAPWRPCQGCGAHGTRRPSRLRWRNPGRSQRCPAQGPGSGVPCGGWGERGNSSDASQWCSSPLWLEGLQTCGVHATRPAAAPQRHMGSLAASHSSGPWAVAAAPCHSRLCRPCAHACAPPVQLEPQGVQMLQAAPNHDAHWDEEAPASQQQPDVGLRGRRRQVVPLETLNSAANCCCVVLGRGSLLPRPRWPLISFPCCTLHLPVQHSHWVWRRWHACGSNAQTSQMNARSPPPARERSWSWFRCQPRCHHSSSGCPRRTSRASCTAAVTAAAVTNAHSQVVSAASSCTAG